MVGTSMGGADFVAHPACSLGEHPDASGELRCAFRLCPTVGDEALRAKAPAESGVGGQWSVWERLRGSLACGRTE